MYTFSYGSFDEFSLPTPSDDVLKVVGDGHGFNVSGGVVFGYKNRLFAKGVTVLGGSSNTASGMYSSISGGNSNTAAEDSSSISGGYGLTASLPFQSIGATGPQGPKGDPGPKGDSGSSAGSPCLSVSGSSLIFNASSSSCGGGTTTVKDFVISGRLY